MIDKYKKILKLASISPVLTNSFLTEDFSKAIILPAEISSSDLGVINTKTGLKAPKWFREVNEKEIKTIVIDGIDRIEAENQEKFYELLKYQTISSVQFQGRIRIIVTYFDIKKVSPTILSLCQVVR